MTKNFKIVCKYIKDLSSETPDIETYLFVRDQIQKKNEKNNFIDGDFEDIEDDHDKKI